MAQWIDLTFRAPSTAEVEVSETPTGEVELAVKVPDGGGAVAVLLTVPQVVEIVRQAQGVLGVTA